MSNINTLQKLKSCFNNALANLHIAVLVPAGGKEQKPYHTGFMQIETVVENQLKKFFSSRSTDIQHNYLRKR